VGSIGELERIWWWSPFASKKWSPFESQKNNHHLKPNLDQNVLIRWRWTGATTLWVFFCQIICYEDNFW
jgi:hypothetical protein